jgi:hypothetical protein
LFDDILHFKKRAFLVAYSEVGNISQAAEIAGVSRQTHYDWLKDDPEYPALFRHAEKQACDRLEQEARRRAVEGVKKPVFHGGKQVGVVQEYSDTLLIFLMKGAMPHKYKDRIASEQSGPGGGPIEMNVQMSRIAGMSDEELKKILGGESGE